MSRQIAVVGAGIAGLAAAYTLQQAGETAIVFEQSDGVGGRMSSHHFDGFTVDVAAQFLTEDYYVIPGLVAQLGMRSDLVRVSNYYGSVRAGKMRRMERGRDLSSLRQGALRPWAWLRLGIARSRLSRLVSSLPISDLAAWTAYDDMDARRWSEGFCGTEATDYVTGPLVEGLFYQSLEENARCQAMVTLHSFLFRKVSFLAVRGGIGSIPARLAEHAEVRLKSPVRTVSVRDQGVDVTLGDETFSADAAIVAAPAPIAAEMYSQASGIEKRLLATPYSTTMTVVLVLDPGFVGDDRTDKVYGILIPAVEGGCVASLTIEGAKNNGCLGDGKMINAYLRCACARAMMDWDDEQVSRRVVADVAPCIPGLRESLVRTLVFRWKHALAVTPVGRAKDVAYYRRTLDPAARVVLAGDYAGMPSTDGAAQSGIWAAEALLKHLR